MKLAAARRSAAAKRRIVEVGVMPVHDWTRVSAGTFHDFHATWIIEIRRALNRGILPPDYYAMAEQVAGSIGPDVLTLQATRPEGNGAAEATTPSGTSEGTEGIALATAPPKVRFTDTAEEDIYARKARSVVIRHTSGDRIVAIVEILSPGNKNSRNALLSFVEKAASAIRADCHLLLIDLHPPGPRDPQGIHRAVWAEIKDTDFVLPPDQPLTLAAYAAGDVKRCFVETVAVGDVLPDMPLFLDPEFYVLVPLEATYRAAWEDVPWRWRGILES
jgi:Protein of unknown function (DUF4058)